MLIICFIPLKQQLNEANINTMTFTVFRFFLLNFIFHVYIFFASFNYFKTTFLELPFLPNIFLFQNQLHSLKYHFSLTVQ